MSIRTILVGASGGTASDGAIDLACRLALRLGAHLQGYHVKSDPSDAIIAASMDGTGMPIVGEWIDRSIEHADKLAARTRAAFFQATERHGLTPSDRPPQASIKEGASVEWREEIGSGTVLIAARARFFDLVVLGRSDRVIDQPASDVIECTLLQSGRPVLLAPAKPPVAIGETIAIGWDGSPRSVRAISAILPLLRQAKKTVILAIDDDPDTISTAPLTDYLHWHGIASDGQKLRAEAGVGRGEQLLSAARDTRADLLAMGAFGQSRWRQMLFGSATQTVVSTSLLSILMTH
jgi:nucleotide-binding universal stress UspA family protein